MFLLVCSSFLFEYSVKFYKIQSLPRLTRLSSNDEFDSVARDAFILSVFTALVVEIDGAGSTLSGVV